MTDIELGEQALRDIGHYVALPFNWLILFTDAERDILCVIRHYSQYHYYISDSFIRIHTGRGRKAITRAKQALINMGVITADYKKNDSRGSHYEINYELLCNIGEELKAAPRVYQRLKIVDEFRGERYKLHTSLIEEYKNTNFNNEYYEEQ